MIPWVVARARLVIAALAAITLVFAAGIPRLVIRTDGEALHPSGDPAVTATARDRERFRDPDAVLVLLEARAPTALLFTPVGLARLREVTAALREVPGVRSDGVASLATAVDVAGSARAVRLSRVLDPLPADAAAIARLRARLNESGLYEGLLYGRDGRSAAILAPLFPGVDRGEVLERVARVASERAGPEFRALLAGPVPAEALLGSQVFADLSRLIPLVVLVVASVLLLGLRSFSHATVPGLQMVCVLAWTFGLMGWTRVPLTIVSSVLPVLLMAMAMSDQIHLLAGFREHRRQGRPRGEAAERSLAEVGPAIVRSAGCTALGFLAFTSASIVALRHFGIFAAIGLGFSLVLSYTLAPALLVLIPQPVRGPAADTGGAGEQGARSGGPEVWLAARPRASLVAAVAIVALATLGLPRLVVQDSWVQNFSPRSDLVAAERLMSTQYDGSYRMDVVLEAAEPEAFVSATGVRLLDSLTRALRKCPEIGGTLSWVDLARSALHGVDSTRSLTALDDAAVAEVRQVLLMTGVQERLDPLLTPSGDRARVLCFVPDADFRKAVRLQGRLDSILAAVPLPPGVRAHASGTLPVATAVVRATVANQFRSVAWTLAGLGLLLAFSYRSAGLALVMLVPVAGTTIAVLGGMGFAGVPLGVATSMFAALSQGEGTNFAVHVVSRFLAGRRRLPARAALLEGIREVGRPMRWNAAALVAGCAVLGVSALRPVRALGGLLVAGLGLSYLLTVLVLPALLLGLDRLAARRGAARARAGPGVAIALSAVLALGAVRPVAAAELERFADEPAARQLMTEIERTQRSGSRLFSMDVTLHYTSRYTTGRRMLVVTRGGGGVTRMLYVVTSPRPVRGATLLIVDPEAVGRSDRMWIHLPNLNTFREIEASSMSLLVPGTGFTYEDSRGWISTDRYHFRTLASGSEEITIEAVPRSEILMDLVGSARLLVRVDPKRRVVTAVVFYDRAGNLVRSYEAREFVQVAGCWLPARVTTQQRVQLLDAEIAYHYAALTRDPPASLFLPSLKPQPFLQRFHEWRDRSGFAADFPDSTSPP